MADNAFIGKTTTGRPYNAGYFLADAENCTRVTAQFDTTNNKGTVTTEGDAKWVKAGTMYPKNDSTATGIVYEDVDVSNGLAAGSIVIAGTVYEERLEASIEEAKSALTNIKFVKEPIVTRPADKEE